MKEKTLKFSVAPLVEDSQIPLISLLTRKRGLYTGEFPDIEEFRVGHSQSEAILCPYNLKSIEDNHKYLDLLRKFSRDKLVILVNFGDFPRRFIGENFILLQTSHEIGTKFDSSKTIIVPLNARSTKTNFRKLRVVPEVSFVGQVPKISTGRILRSVLPIKPSPIQWSFPHPIKRNSALIRRLGVRSLHDMNATVIPRRHHSGTSINVTDTRFSRELYELVLSNSDIFFCPRGDANASLRLYETFGAGRFPLIPRTNIYLPDLKGESIDGLFISCSALMRDAPKQIERWWASLTPETYLEKQHSLRNIFFKHFSYKRVLEEFFRGTLDSAMALRPTII